MKKILMLALFVFAGCQPDVQESTLPPVAVDGPAKIEAAIKVEASQVASPATQAQFSEADAMALAKKKNCFACHALDKKLVGPAWKAVADKYRADADAQAFLEAKVRKGGKGIWGSVAMPPQPALTGDELTVLVQFILRIK